MTSTKPKCRGHRTDGSPCDAYPVHGAVVCVAHGARAPQVKEAAARRLATAAVQADAAALLAAEGVGPIGDPYDSLERLATEVMAVKRAAAARVNALGSAIRYTSGQGAEQLRAEVALYERSLDRAVKILETLSKLGLDERRVQVQEKLADQVGGVIEAVLAELDLTASQQAIVPSALGRHLVALRGGAA